MKRDKSKMFSWLQQKQWWNRFGLYIGTRHWKGFKRSRDINYHYLPRFYSPVKVNK